MSEEILDNGQSAGEMPDIYNLSDEEIMNLDPSQFGYSDEPEINDEEEDSPADETMDADEDLSDTDQDDADLDTDDAEDGADSDDGEQETADDEIETGDSEDGDDTSESDEEKETEDEDEGEDADTGETNYEEVYKQIFAPFKAGGKEIQVESPEEVIQLMQKGVDYNKKMVGLKPHLKILKTLENQGLLEEDKIGFLIDLANKDQKAIGKLLKDSGVDPLDLDVDANDYTPGKHTVSDAEMELDDVLDRIQDSDHYSKTVDLVSKQWDAASKKFVAQTPQLLEVINDHMSTGVYDVIAAELDRKRALGQLDGLSDLEAYKQVGDSIQERGGFDHLFQDRKKDAGQEQGQQDAKPAKRLPPKQKQVDPKLNEKRRAASPTKGKPAKSKTAADFNPLALSDEEFEKHFSQKLL